MGASLASHQTNLVSTSTRQPSGVSESNTEEDLRVPAFALSLEEVCPGCGLHSDHEEALLERHIYRCPLGAVKYFMHRGLAYVVARILRQAGAAKTDIVFEVRIQPQTRRQDETCWRCGLAELLGTWPAPADRCLHLSSLESTEMLFWMM